MEIIEIDISKLEIGTHYRKVRYVRGGKVFWRRQRVGRKTILSRRNNRVFDIAPVKTSKKQENYTLVDDIEDLDGNSNIYFRVEADGGENAKLGDMLSVIGSDQIETECDMCGSEIDLDYLDDGCPECGAEASQANKYAKMIDDFDLDQDENGNYILPGILAFDSHSAAYEYANNVAGGEVVAYRGEELYYGMQEPDTDNDEFLITPLERFRDRDNV